MVICTHAASLCELYMPFNKSLIVVASTRYEIGRHDSKRWQAWNENLRRIGGKEGGCSVSSLSLSCLSLLGLY